MAKQFKSAINKGLDGLIQQTTELNETIDEKDKEYKTSIMLPESIYLKFKGLYLTPRKQSLKDYVIQSMKETMKKEGML